MGFEVILKPDAIRDLDRLRKYDATCIADAIERHLTTEPEKVSRSRIKRLRGRQPGEYRLRVGAFRVFYTVDPEASSVAVLRILHNLSEGRTMKVVPLAEVRNNLTRYLEETRKGPVFITRNGRIAGVLEHLRDEDVEDYLLERSPRFRAMLERARDQKGGMSLSEYRKSRGV